jgi:hypothetical protein
MSRLVVLILSLLLPLQFAWSASTLYCKHDVTHPAHFGHESHVHEAGTEKSVDSKFCSDTDCASCHAASTPLIATKQEMRTVLLMSTAMGSLTPPAFKSALARAPDRPQWLRLV